MTNIPTNLPSVEKLLQRTRVAEKTQQKEIKISIEEAKDLTTELAILTSKLGTTIAQIHEMLVEINKNSNEVDVKFDGGSF